MELHNLKESEEKKKTGVLRRVGGTAGIKNERDEGKR
jgi:hypothetical protein